MCCWRHKPRLSYVLQALLAAVLRWRHVFSLLCIYRSISTVTSLTAISFRSCLFLASCMLKLPFDGCAASLAIRRCYEPWPWRQCRYCSIARKWRTWMNVRVRSNEGCRCELLLALPLQRQSVSVSHARTRKHTHTRPFASRRCTAGVTWPSTSRGEEIYWTARTLSVVGISAPASFSNCGIRPRLPLPANCMHRQQHKHTLSDPIPSPLRACSFVPAPLPEKRTVQFAAVGRCWPFDLQLTLANRSYAIFLDMKIQGFLTAQRLRSTSFPELCSCLPLKEISEVIKKCKPGIIWFCFSTQYRHQYLQGKFLLCVLLHFNRPISIEFFFLHCCWSVLISSKYWNYLRSIAGFPNLKTPNNYYRYFYYDCYRTAPSVTFKQQPPTSFSSYRQSP